MFFTSDIGYSSLLTGSFNGEKYRVVVEGERGASEGSKRGCSLLFADVASIHLHIICLKVVRVNISHGCELTFHWY